MTDETHARPAMIYDVDLVIDHPSENPDVISSELGLQPDYICRAGQPRTAPNGAPMPGFNQDNHWAMFQQVEGHRLFSTTVGEVVGTLEAAADYLRPLLASGGKARITVNLPGWTNIGDIIVAADLVRMGRLGIDLGIEVFPNMR